MKNETFILSKRYVVKKVIIHNQKTLLNAAKSGRGIVLAPLHYGSFFLIGPAIAIQTGFKSTAIVTNANLSLLPEKEEKFWRGVHRRTELAQGERLFYAGVSDIKDIVNFLNTQNSVLWAMLDVREAARPRKEYPFKFQNKTYYFQVGAAKLACLADAIFMPVCIKYDSKKNIHNLYIGKSIYPSSSPVEMTQLALDQLTEMVKAQNNQFFHNLDFFLQPNDISKK